MLVEGNCTAEDRVGAAFFVGAGGAFWGAIIGLIVSVVR